ncbi:MAG: menaquinone biosynthetic enzyme MqnA/MqnD family protein [Blastocatellia bacterium]
MRIAASTYLNSAPLVDRFSRGGFGDRYRFIGNEAPARCAEMLAEGACEIALIPVIEYQRIAGVRIVPDVAVASKGRVRSVLIATRRPLEEVRRLTLDASSRTSQGLVRILFQERYGFLPELIERTPDAARGCENMLESSDAALVIGDPAMRLEASASRLGVRIHDLAEEWRGMTGLPFVFAVWAVREAVWEMSHSVAADFLEAKAEGVGQIERIAAQYAAELGLPEADLLTYLRENVNYDLDGENIAGLRRYFELARKWELISENRELSFLGEDELRDVARSGVQK